MLYMVFLAVCIVVCIWWGGPGARRRSRLDWTQVPGVTRRRGGVVVPIGGLSWAPIPSELADTRRFELVGSSTRSFGGSPVVVLARGQRIGVLEGAAARKINAELRRRRLARLLVEGELTGRHEGRVVLPYDFSPATLELPAGPARAFPVPVPVEAWGSATTTVDAVRCDFFLTELSALYPDGRPPSGTSGGTLSGLGAEIFPTGQGRIGVFIDDRQIGWLAAAHEISHRQELEDLAAGGHSLRVKVSVRVGTGDRPSVRVRIWLPEVDQILPPGAQIEDPHVLLPPGSTVQVTGEEEHLDELVAMLGDEHEVIKVAELYLFTRQTARTLKQIVGVRIDGRPVGELTSVSGAHFEAVLRACSERGLRALCRATISGNQLKTDVTLNVTKGGSLTSQWISRHILARPGVDSHPVLALEDHPQQDSGGEHQSQ